MLEAQTVAFLRHPYARGGRLVVQTVQLLSKGIPMLEAQTVAF